MNVQIGWLIGLGICGIFQIVFSFLMRTETAFSAFIFQVLPFFSGLFTLSFAALTYFKII